MKWAVYVIEKKKKEEEEHRRRAESYRSDKDVSGGGIDEDETWDPIDW